MIHVGEDSSRELISTKKSYRKTLTTNIIKALHAIIVRCDAEKLEKVCVSWWIH
jgi:hypothetical protein